MIGTRRTFDVVVSCAVVAAPHVLEGHEVLVPQIVVSVKFNRPWRGTDGVRRVCYTDPVALGDGNPITRLKESLARLEELVGLRFEAFEAVDVTRQFCAHAQRLGFRIRGFPLVESAA
jgi:hypothetical protein